DRVGDLLIVSQRLWTLNQQAPRPALSEGLGELSRLLELLHSQALTARLTSFSMLTDRLPRVVRDLARQAGKRATLVVRGADEQVDRAIIEGLDAPITHLLRNAIEHGVETPDERSAAHKAATGVLTLSCVRVRDEIVIELGDDGRGIDRDAVVERAVAMGLLERAAAERAADRDLRRILCLPGFTTREKAGALAGRGVGMDAVYEQVTELGGLLEVHSTQGVGTLFRLRLPRSPGIGKLLLVQAGEQTFGLPLGRVVRTASFTAAELQTGERGPTVRYQDEPHRVVRLATALGFGEGPLAERFPAVIVRHGREELVLAVDGLVGQQDAVVKPLGPVLERIEGLGGVTLDAVGQPVFVVDLSRLGERP
ncbi:MAG: chemotaxis protein CheW, partial [Myxococcales bacterium]|nr:chemotaxis protein CheW [Myxococcales bacterium]